RILTPKVTNAVRRTPGDNDTADAPSFAKTSPMMKAIPAADRVRNFSDRPTAYSHASLYRSLSGAGSLGGCVFSGAGATVSINYLFLPSPNWRDKRPQLNVNHLEIRGSSIGCIFTVGAWVAAVTYF